MTTTDTHAAGADDVDRAVLRALAHDGRASWATIGELAGCSTSTAQRRVTRLVEDGAVRIIAASDVLASGFGVSTKVRVRSGAARADALADALARRPEVRFVSTLTGSADCTAEVVLPRVGDLTAFLSTIEVDGRPVETEALPIVRTFTAPFTVFPGDALAPTAERSTTANAPAPDPSTGQGVTPVHADATPEERAVFAALVRDGRKPLTDLAREVGRSEAATRRTLEDLVQSGRLRIGPLVAPSLLGRATELEVWISVAPDRLSAAAAQLAGHPSVHYAAASLGRFNLIGQAFLPDFASVYTFSTDVLGALPGVREVDVTVQLRTVKRMWSRIEEGRFVPTSATSVPAIP
ncbi:DNA-binding Lrp family transcriptional regulator [Curtobacterium sp. PhB130]|uniref:Lrp/AsnC family transcriptional regulator n=1 Tax=Curtobacterium sp. PhB130 TaxID=2485178 RepID=UPI000F4C0348|nr:Lrp/AsnC family transcriptional regulator [Curtobacterium sp. PhB130]ROS74080.1 DNA-binding Lrp family transcriptional regulator [Curtobacterium sp. PhB130]